MTYSARVDQLEEDAKELAVRMSIVLSIILTLAAAAILSKYQLTNYLWVDVVALTVPLFLASYFKDRVVSLGAYAYAAGLTVILGLAVLFGM
jgi:hypothetical protein